MFRLLISLLIFFCVFKYKAQHPFYYSLNDENGLPSNEVYQIVQDSKGYIWIGCDAGLYRYNGYSYKAYKNANQNSRSISNLLFDSENVLWCRNFSGQIFKLLNDSLYLVADYSNRAKNIQIAFNDNGFWKVDKEYLSKHDKNAKQIEKYNIPFHLDTLNSGVEMIFYNNTLWVEFVGFGLYYFDENSKAFNKVLDDNYKGNYNSILFFKHKNSLYLLRSESEPYQKVSIFKIEYEAKKAILENEFHNKNNTRIYAVYADNKDNIWICSSNGASQFSSISQINLDTKKLFPDFKISSVLHDQENVYWFTDLQNGIHIIPNLSSIKFDSKNSPLFDSDISSLKRINDSLIVIGTYSGNIFIYNSVNDKFDYPQEINAIKGITVKDIEVYKNKLVVSRGKLLIYDLMSKKTIAPDAFRNARDLIIYNDTIIAVHPEFVSKSCINNIENNKSFKYEKIYKTGGRKIVRDLKTDNIYLALNDGLYLYANQNFSKIKFQNEEVYVFSITNDEESVWLGTLNKGILKIQNSKISEQFKLPEDYKDIGIKSISVNNQFIWGCTNSNWFRMDKKTGEIQTYSNNIGVNPKDVYDIANTPEFLLVASRKNLIKIPIGLAPVNNHKPNLFLLQIKTDEQYYPINKELVLPFNFTNLKFDFISFSYSSKNDFCYQYRLIGLDSNWIKIPFNNPQVSFSSLSPGNYQLEIRSVNESGITSEKYSHSFIVQTPLWQKGWFYFITSVGSIAVVVLITRYQINIIKKRNEAEKKMIQSQLTALKAQMNPHFMYNALNSIQALILKQDIKNSNLYLSKFSNLMRKVLDVSGKDEIYLHEEVDILDLYLSLEKLRFGEDFKYLIIISPEIDSYQVMLPPLLLQPFVENAIKHGLLHKKGEKRLEIHFYLQDKFLYCSIKDNGIGRKHAMEIKERLNEKHRSFSTSATEKRVELLNNFVSSNFEIGINDLYENNIPAGTEVIIKIPM